MNQRYTQTPATLTLLCCSLTAYAQPSPAVPELAPVQAQTAHTAPQEEPLDSGTASVNTIRVQDTSIAQVDDLAAQVAGAKTEVNDAGLTSTLQLRGFGAQKFVLSGLPDVERMFVRDAATAESITVLRGPTGPQAGMVSPGGTVWFQGKTASAQAQKKISLEGGNSSWWRGVIDINQPISPTTSARWVYYAQDGLEPHSSTLRPARHGHWLSGQWRYAPQGRIDLEWEQQNNQRPYIFGTLFAQGNIQYNRLYASPQSLSSRNTHRQALRWQHEISASAYDTFSVHADVSRAHVERDELLLGVWALVNQQKQFSSYMSQITDNAVQHNARIEGRWQADRNVWHWDHRLGWAWNRLNIALTGVQSIAALRLDTSNPDWTLLGDGSQLTSTPRWTNEEHVNRSLYLQQQVSYGSLWRAVADARYTDYRLNYQRHNSKGPQSTSGNNLMYRLGFVLWPTSDSSPYGQISSGSEPNLGYDRNGKHLLPRRSQQIELGWRTRYSHMAAFRINQHRMPAPDPLDRNALVLSAQRHVQGFEVSTNWRSNAPEWGVTSHWQWLQTQQNGARFVGVPRHIVNVKLDATPRWLSNAPNPKLWAQLQAQTNMAANSQNTLFVPAQTVLSVGVQQRLNAQWKLNMQVNNVLNTRYITSVSAPDTLYQGPNRQWRVQLQWQDL